MMGKNGLSGMAKAVSPKVSGRERRRIGSEETGGWKRKRGTRLTDEPRESGIYKVSNGVGIKRRAKIQKPIRGRPLNHPRPLRKSG